MDHLIRHIEIEEDAPALPVIIRLATKAVRQAELGNFRKDWKI